MGNNPILGSSSESSKDITLAAAKARNIYEQFEDDLIKVKREHRGRIDAILKIIDERTIKDLKEKMKAL